MRLKSDNSPKRALFVLPIDLPGGAERVVSAIASTLAMRDRWRVEVVTLAGAPQISESRGGFVAERIGPAQISYGRGGGRFLSEVQLLGVVWAQEYDLVFSTHLRVNAFLSLCRKYGILKTVRLVTRESTTASERATGVKLAMYRLLYRCYGAQDLIIAQTGHMAESLRSLISPDAYERVEVLRNPIDLKSIAEAAKLPMEASLDERLKQRPHVVWCGRFIEVKNPMLAVDAFSECRKHTDGNLGMVMIGDGPLRSAIEQRISDLRLGDHIVLLGHLANPHNVMGRCEVGLITSRVEGFPNVLLEMLASGVYQVVTTPCAGDLASVANVSVCKSSDTTVVADELSASLTQRRDGEAKAEFADNDVSRFLDRIIQTPRPPQ